MTPQEESNVKIRNFCNGFQKMVMSTFKKSKNRKFEGIFHNEKYWVFTQHAAVAVMRHSATMGKRTRSLVVQQPAGRYIENEDRLLLTSMAERGILIIYRMFSTLARTLNKHRCLRYDWNKFPVGNFTYQAWWRLQMEKISTLLAICAGNYRSMTISPHRGQWRGDLMFFICFWIDGWVNNREAGDLRRYRVHCDVIVMSQLCAAAADYCRYRQHQHFCSSHLNQFYLTADVWDKESIGLAKRTKKHEFPPD